MPNRHVGRILYAVLISSLFVGSFYLSATLLKALATPPPTPHPVTTKVVGNDAVPPARLNPPVRLEIATIAVNTLVKPVGLTSEGTMAIDEDITQTAWYEPGPRPGEKGSAVIAGHYGWKQGQPSVFNNLHTLVAGDKISVYDANSVPVSFIVQKIQSYDPAADATEVFQSSDGLSHLNLITCEGSWNTSQQTYSQRLVVFTNKDG